MRILTGVIAANLILSAPAFAAEAEGLIKSIDKEAMTITLDDGKAYKLNGEMDLDTLKEGMDIVLAYDETNGENIVTDMTVFE